MRCASIGRSSEDAVPMTEQKIKERNNPGLQTRIMLLCAGALMALLGYFAWTTVYSSDDYWYSTFWDQGLGHYLELMDYHYREFNGRVLVHVLAHIVLHFDRWAFVVMCCGLTGATCMAMARGAGLDKDRSMTAVCLFLVGLLCTPLQVFNQGVMWISASCNYFFPAALACLLAAALERESRWAYPLAFLCGATTEQMGLASAALAAVYVIHGLLRRKGIIRNLSCTALALVGVLTIFLSPATAKRADARVHMDSLAVILETFRKAILREASILTENPAPIVVMLAILVFGAWILCREKGWKWSAVPAGLGCVMLLCGCLPGDTIRLAGFVAAFLALALMALLLLIAGRSFAGALTLTGLAAAAVMLPTNTVEPRVMLPVYFLLLVSACGLGAELIRHRAAAAAAGLVLAALISIPAIGGYWANYQVDLMNERFAQQDREREAVRYCTDYNMEYTWVKADYDPYFRMKYLESIGLPETGKVDFFSMDEERAFLRYEDQILLGAPWTSSEGTLMLPMREVTEVLGGSVEWTADRQAISLDGVVLELEAVGSYEFIVRLADGRELRIDWLLRGSAAYCDAALFEEGFGITVREEPEQNLYIIEK